MENMLRYMCGGVAAVAALFAPIRPLVLCAVAFIAIDFVTGVAADRKRACAAGTPWAFESGHAWTTVLKLGFVWGGIALAWLIDAHILSFMKLNLANLFTGFVCGVELWSYLENAAEISDHPIFRQLKRYMKRKLDDRIGGEEE